MKKRFIIDDPNIILKGNSYYIKFLVMDSLISFVSLISIVIAIVYYESSYKDSKNDQYDIYLYFSSALTVLLFVNIYILESLTVKYTKDVEGISISLISRWYYFLFYFIISIMHPNILFKGKEFYEYNRFSDQLIKNKYNDIAVVLIFVRVIFILKGIIYNSEYLKPDFINLCKSYSFQPGLSYGLKCIIRKHTFKFYLVTYISLTLTLSYMIRIFERPVAEVAKTGLGNYFNIIWFVSYTLLTSGYGEYYIRSFYSKILIMFTCTFGFFLLSLMIISVNNLLEIKSNENYRISILERADNNNEEIESARKSLLLLIKMHHISSKNAGKNILKELTKKLLFLKNYHIIKDSQTNFDIMRLLKIISSLIKKKGSRENENYKLKKILEEIRSRIMNLVEKNKLILS